MTHFAQRCRERGVPVADTEALFAALCDAVANERDDKVKLVLRTDRARFWRFMVDGCIFYAITGLTECRPKTVITQDMMRKKKWAWKAQKKKRPLLQKHKG